MDVQTVIQGNVFWEIVNRSFPFEEDMRWFVWMNYGREMISIEETR